MTKTKNLRLGEDVCAILEELAEKEDRTQTSIVSRAIRQYAGMVRENE